MLLLDIRSSISNMNIIILAILDAAAWWGSDKIWVELLSRKCSNHMWGDSTALLMSYTWNSSSSFRGFRLVVFVKYAGRLLFKPHLQNYILTYLTLFVLLYLLYILT